MGRRGLKKYLAYTYHTIGLAALAGVFLMLLPSAQADDYSNYAPDVPNAVTPEKAYDYPFRLIKPWEFDGKNVKQPIKFPHYIHVKINKMNCMYCHTYARRSNVSGIPPLSKCMSCHSIIATDKPRIKKLTEYWNKGEAPPWKKVNDLPDFVHFSHQKHLRKFIFDNPGFDVVNTPEVCAFCHGEVKNMVTDRKVKPLNMGFCRRCHEANKGPFDCWKCHV